MKNTLRSLGSWLFTGHCLFCLLGLFSAAPANLFAQAADAAASAGALVDAATPEAEGAGLGQILTAAVALISGLFGIWSHKQKKTAQKVAESLVVGIEAASRIPAIAEKEKQIKATIQRRAEAYGVQPVLHEIVKRVT